MSRNLTRTDGLVAVAEPPDRLFEALLMLYTMSENATRDMQTALPLWLAQELVKIPPLERMKLIEESRFHVPQLERAMDTFARIFEFTNWMLPGRLLAILDAQTMAEPLRSFFESKDQRIHEQLIMSLGGVIEPLLESQHLHQIAQTRGQLLDQTPSSVLSYYTKLPTRYTKYAVLMLLPEITVKVHEDSSHTHESRGNGEWHNPFSLHFTDILRGILCDRQFSHGRFVYDEFGDNVPVEGLPRMLSQMLAGDVMRPRPTIEDVDFEKRIIWFNRLKGSEFFGTHFAMRVFDAGVGASPKHALLHPWRERTPRAPMRGEERQSAIRMIMEGFQGVPTEGTRIAQVGILKAGSASFSSHPLLNPYYRNLAMTLAFALETGTGLYPITDTADASGDPERNFFAALISPGNEFYDNLGHILTSPASLRFRDDGTVENYYKPAGGLDHELMQAQVGAPLGWQYAEWLDAVWFSQNPPPTREYGQPEHNFGPATPRQPGAFLEGPTL